MINYPFNFEKIRAIFISRENRFVVKAKIENKIFDCYLPNPGRLFELLIPFETELILVKNDSSSKIPFTVLACIKKGRFVLLHTHVTNYVVKSLIEEQKLNFFKGFTVISQEVKIEGSRFDFLLENNRERLLLEIKTCTLFGDRVAMFPDAITERGRRHLIELSELAKRGFKTSVLFVVMNHDVRFFLPAYHIDFAFAKSFIDVEKLVEFKAITLDWDEGLSFVRSVKGIRIPFPFLKEVVKDRGVYVLVAQMKESKSINVGHMVNDYFPSGYYVYVGKARKGLFKRLARHRRRIKKMHWHIDYLLDKAQLIKDFPIVTKEDIECAIGDRLSKICDKMIPHFGSSDCKCYSHLFYFRENPLYNKDFIEMITFFRLDFISTTLTFREVSRDNHD